MAIEDRTAHARMLNARRQARHRERKRNARNGLVVTDNGTLHPRLTRLAGNLARGMSNAAALVEAGYSRNSKQLIDIVRPQLAAMLKAKGLTPETVIDSTMERIAAESPMMGPVTEESPDGMHMRPAWDARTQGCRDAIALLDRAGELPQPDAPTSHHTPVRIYQVLADGSRQVIEVE